MKRLITKAIEISFDEKINKHVIQAYILKAGFVFSKIKNEFTSFDDDSSTDAKDFWDNYSNDLYSKLEKSEFVMEIIPKPEKFKHLAKSFSAGFTSLGAIAQIYDFLKLRITISKQKRREITSGIFDNCRFTPESFTTYFNGSLFFTISTIDHAPTYTDIGHVSREIIICALKKCKFIENQVTGPSPIHPDIYIFEMENDYFQDAKNKSVFSYEDNLYILTPHEVFDDDTIPFVMHKLSNLLRDFYKLMIFRSAIMDCERDFLALDENLSTQLAEYFNKNFLKRFFISKSGEMRKTISKMHINMNQITKKQNEYRDDRNCFFKDLKNDRFFCHLENYFSDLLEENLVSVDFKSELSFINFTISETSDLNIVKATILSGFIGGLIGSLLSLINLGN